MYVGLFSDFLALFYSSAFFVSWQHKQTRRKITRWISGGRKNRDKVRAKDSKIGLFFDFFFNTLDFNFSISGNTVFYFYLTNSSCLLFLMRIFTFISLFLLLTYLLKFPKIDYFKTSYMFFPGFRAPQSELKVERTQTISKSSRRVARWVPVYLDERYS